MRPLADSTIIYNKIKKCVLCQETKPISEFHKNSRSKDGLHSYCKTCNMLKAREYLKTPKGKVAGRRYFQSDKGKESVRRALKKYFKTDKGKESLKKAINKKIEEGYYRFGKGAISRLKQSSKLRGIECDITPEQLEHWWLSTKDHCQYCGISQNDYIKLRDFILQYEGEDWEIIKFKRFFKTGRQKAIRWMTIDRADNTRGYLIDNIVKSCWICNSLKSDFFSFSLMKQLGPEIINQLLKKIQNV